MSVRILWADDEIDLLKPHILFLEAKSYSVDAVISGVDAIRKSREFAYDVIFLDEQMPGLSGLQTLEQIKAFRPDTPVVMITKNEEENIMEAAIGSQIADYLIKPVNPNQILHSLKKILQVKTLVTQKTESDYRSEFGKIGVEIGEAETWTEWCDVYRKLINWDLQFTAQDTADMKDVLQMQMSEANRQFSKYIKSTYKDWFKGSDDKPLLTPNIIKETVIPRLKAGDKTVLLVIDNLRLDQWKIIRPLIKEFFTVEQDTLCCAILPTTTQYSRNALFAGLLPSAIAEKYPQYWKNDEEEDGKNLYEEDLLREQLVRNGFSDKFYFEKVTAAGGGKKLSEKISNMMSCQLSVIVYNFVDTLSHARTEMEIIKELANDEAAYRSLTLTWFRHSPLYDFLRKLSEEDVSLVITTDHGSVKGLNAIQVVGERTITTNLRYKTGKSLKYNAKEVFEIKEPKQIGLPVTHLSSSYIFATKNDFFAYPNNFNHYAKYYRDTFQHGGISLEEMIIPLACLRSK